MKLPIKTFPGPQFLSRFFTSSFLVNFRILSEVLRPQILKIHSFISGSILGNNPILALRSRCSRWQFYSKFLFISYPRFHPNSLFFLSSMIHPHLDLSPCQQHSYSYSISKSITNLKSQGLGLTKFSPDIFWQLVLKWLTPRDKRPRQNLFFYVYKYFTQDCLNVLTFRFTFSYFSSNF